jgi:hypothetical protein
LLLWLDSIIPLFLSDYLWRTHDFCLLCVVPVQLADGRFENARTVQARVTRERSPIAAKGRWATAKNEVNI